MIHPAASQPGGPAPRGPGVSVRVVSFDLMDTLLRDPYREAVVAATGLTFDELAHHREPGIWELFELGLIDEPDYAQRFFRHSSPHRLDIGRLRRALERGYEFLPGMEELLAELADRYPVHLLSNYPIWYRDLCRRFALDRFISGHHPSHEVGARKPDPDYFHRVLERLDLEPAELLFVDDARSNVDAAAALGIRAVRFEGAAALRDALKSILP
jgi:HAD superfamily hydrolase (TIGR01509 family)